jgi:hypothetical protein
MKIAQITEVCRILRERAPYQHFGGYFGRKGTETTCVLGALLWSRGIKWYNSDTEPSFHDFDEIIDNFGVTNDVRVIFLGEEQGLRYVVVYMNDGMHWNFNQIADFIEQNVIPEDREIDVEAEFAKLTETFYVGTP